MSLSQDPSDYDGPESVHGFNLCHYVPMEGPTMGCGARVPREAYTTRRGRLVSAATTIGGLCSKCHFVKTVNDPITAMARAMDRAAVPLKLRGWSLERQIRQLGDESERELWRRASIRDGHWLGVTHRNAPAYECVGEWRTVDGSMWLEGPAGAGKSTLAAAMVADRVRPVAAEWGSRSDEWLQDRYGDKWMNVTDNMRRFKVDVPGAPFMYVDEAELKSRVELSWSGDRDPLNRISDMKALVLDDIGSGMVAASGKTKELLIRFTSQLITYRYDNNLPTIFTSNHPISWAQVYGARVYSRLREMCYGNVFEIVAPDLRTLERSA